MHEEEQIAVPQEDVINKQSIGKHKIVYVDDEDHNLRVFKSLFRRFYDIILFSNPLEALEYLRREDVSILISDQQMPEMKGTELIEIISKEKEELTTIILTGYSDMEVIKNAINKCNIYRFITKPYDFEELKADFNNALITDNLRKDKEKLIEQIQAQNLALEESMKMRTEELGYTNNRLIESIKYAEKIQQSILTDEALLTDVFDQVMIYYRPLDIVSGDFYLFKRIENKYLICFFDCTGHGVPGAILSMLGSAVLHNLIGKGITKPSELLIGLNNEIYRRLNASGNTNDGMEGGIILFNKDSDVITYSGAKADMILLKGGQLERVRSNRTSLGERYLPEETIVEQSVLNAKEISSFFLFSDGFKDQINEEGTEKYNSKRFNELLHRVAQENMKDQISYLDQELTNWKGSSDQIDDITILGFKI